MTTPLQEISLQLPFNYQIPELYLQGNPELIATALTLGAESCRILTEEAYTKVRNETHQEIISEVKKQTDQEIISLRKQKEDTEELLEQTSRKIRRLEQDLSVHEERIRQEERRNREEIAKEKDARIQALEQQLRESRESSKSLTEGFQQLREQMIRNTTGSTNRGKEGEAQVEELLKLAYGSAPSFDLNPVAKEGHKGDFIMDYERTKLLWEVKNYSRMVNKDEVEKLHRDMRENPEAAVGIMISLQTGIVGHTKAGDIDIEFIGSGTGTTSIRCIVYISNFHQRQDKVFYLQSLRPLLDLVAKQSQQIRGDLITPEESEEAKQLEALRSRSVLVQNLLATHQAQIQRHFNSLTNHKKRSEQMFAELQSFVRESEGHVREMLRVIIGNIDESLTTDELKHLSERVFKKTSSVEMNEKERKFLLWLLKVAEEDEYGQITIKDLVDKARDSEEAFSEKEVRGYRETLFQDLAWQKGGKLIVGLKWRD